ncbi:hypothetical protein BUALT_Bualt14G0129100 [Buddleja alternifolia]|uniref:Pectinesterase inhibitor domain-containing protein n=1 Tax=Buddleja alternifolia TaxID=168488 RepID=A0AAV6WUD4_9LAMI|nr:hypothetical protein BUALT_Bualt14G0129100 [Buddleja alternifolia]
MDSSVPIKKTDTIIDIESCLVIPVLSDDTVGNIDTLVKSENKSNNPKNVGELSPETNHKNEKCKSLSAKKPPKPPRPPRGLSLDAADQKLIKELSELAMIKRARIERMKALKKMKAAKGSTVSGSSSGNFIAMLFTFLFCIVIIFQGCHFSGFSQSNSPAIGILSSPESNGVKAASGSRIFASVPRGSVFINSTCAKTRYDDICRFIFGDFDKSTTVRELVETAVLKTDGIVGFMLLGKLPNSKNETKDPILLKEYDFCIKQYDEAYNVDIPSAKSSLNGSDYGKAAASLYHVGEDADTCNNGFKDINPISVNNLHVRQFAYVTGDLVKMLK